MRKSFRPAGSNPEYWEARWREADADREQFDDPNIYPIRYAEAALRGADGPVLEAGCGLGRLVRHYHRRGVSIIGLEYDFGALKKIHGAEPSVRLARGDVRRLPFKSGAFAALTAFGVIHNLETGMDECLSEMARVLKPGGRICVSARPDNIETHLADGMRGTGRAEKQFHKWAMTEDELTNMVSRAGFRVRYVHRAFNVPALYRLRWARAAQSESDARSRGYRLVWPLDILYRLLRAGAPGQFCNVIVVIADKP